MAGNCKGGTTVPGALHWPVVESPLVEVILEPEKRACPPGRLAPCKASRWSSSLRCADHPDSAWVGLPGESNLARGRQLKGAGEREAFLVLDPALEHTPSSDNKKYCFREEMALPRGLAVICC
jgi:hypothetical protein